MAYTVKTLAKHWDCSPKFIYGLIRDGRLKAFSISGAKSNRAKGTRITEEAVEEFRLASTMTAAARADTPGVVYFADCGPFTKIGFTASKDWMRRIAGIRTNNPYPITPWAVIKGGVAIERQIHSLLSDYRHSLEWFDLGEIGRSTAMAIIKTRNGQLLGDENV